MGVAGGLTVVTGIILMPLPGPGTLIALGGLTWLGREFPAAAGLARRLRSGSARDEPFKESGHTADPTP